MRMHAFTPQQLAAILRGQRQVTKRTQKQAAELVGLLPKTISMLESQPQKCSVESLYKLLAAIDLELVLQPRGKMDTATVGSEW